MSKKQKKIIVGTAIVALGGWILGEIGEANTTDAFLILIGIPLVIGSGWAFLAKD